MESSKNASVTDSSPAKARIRYGKQHGGPGYDRIHGLLSEKVAGC